MIALSGAAHGGQATQLAIAAGNNQTAAAGAAVSGIVCVIVSDASNNPVQGVVVTFGNVTGGGSITGAVQSTNSTGIATLGSWVLGPATGINTLTASSPGLPTVTFTANGVVGPAKLTAVVGDNQVAPVGTAVAGPVTVIVADASNSPLAGVAVDFGNVTGGGTLTGASQSTDVNGKATLGSWTLGPSAGTNSLSATVAGLPPVTFTATGTLASIQLSISAGNGQSAIAGTVLPGAVSVFVNDSVTGAPYSGIAVAFGVQTGGGTLGGAAQVTDANGIATLGSWKLGVEPGSNTLTASSPGLTPVTFSATGIDGPTQMEIAAGNNQVVAAGTAVPGVVCVVVRDAQNLPKVGVTVTWINPTNGGNISGANQITDFTGTATLGAWTLGATPGANTLTATSAGLPSLVFSATGLGPPPRFASPPQTPPPAIIGQAVTFSAVSNSNAYEIAWDFGDGTGAPGATVTHIYAAPGVYQATATLSDGVNQAVETVDVAVNTSTPNLDGGTGKLPNVFKVMQGSLKLNFAKASLDTIQLSGTVPLPMNFSPANKKIVVAIGSLRVESELDARGGSANKSLTLRGKLKNGLFVDTPAKFTFARKTALIYEALQAYGFNNANVAKPGVKIEVPVIVSIDGTSFLDTITFVYTAKALKTGAAKSQ